MTTKLNLLRQDPSVALRRVDSVPVEVSKSGPTLQSKDFQVELGPSQPLSEIPSDPDQIDKFMPFNLLGHLQNNLDTFASYCDQMPPTWSDGETRLSIYPNWDWGFNCFYSNGHSSDMQKAGLYFCEGKDPIDKKSVFAGMSSELIAHEQGHAILDRFRPQYNSPGVSSTESFALGESFGDVFAMLMELKAPGIAAAVIAQTEGDLSQHNVVADFAEQFGIGLNHKEEAKGNPPNASGGHWMRTAINHYRWQDPKTLGDGVAQPDGLPSLTDEYHSFSQIWTGASYDILQGMTEQRMASGLDPTTSLEQSTEDMLKLYGKFVSTTAPVTRFNFQDAAKSFLQADRLLGGQWSGLIESVMVAREILPAVG